MFFTYGDCFLIDVYGTTKSVSIAESSPKRNKSLFDIFFNHLFKSINIKLIVKFLFIIDVGDSSLVVDHFYGKGSERTDVTALTIISYKF